MTVSPDRLLKAYAAWVEDKPTLKEKRGMKPEAIEHQRELKRRTLENAGRQYAASLYLESKETAWQA